MKQKLLILLCALMATVSASAYDFSDDYNGTTFYFNKTSDTTCEVTSGGEEYSGDIVIPSAPVYKGTSYTVTSIGNSAFYYCYNLRWVKIPDSVTEIGYRAFSGCYGLTSIVIPNSVTSIGGHAFHETALYNDQSNWDNGVLYIGNYLIEAQADKLPATYVIKAGTTCIANSAFSNCRILISIVIPNSVTSIGSQAFFYCSSLTSIEIPNSVTEIGSSAFLTCSSLTSIEIPNTVTEIGYYAFENCTSLISIKVINENPSNISLGGYVFSKVPTSTCTLYVPKGSKVLYESADQWKDFKNIEEFDNSTTGIENIESVVDDNTPYYDLMGRKVVNPTSGIYIHNGKKVLVK